MVEIPREVLSEHIQAQMQGRVLKTAVFLTFCFDPGFFEQLILPVFLDVPLSHEPNVSLVQLEDAIRERVDHLAVYYDPRGVEAGSDSAKLDVRRIPVSWPTGFFHPKNALLLLEDAEPNEQGEREQRLLVAALSANLTRKGWWENVEVCHVEELRQGEKSSLRGDLLRLISRVKGASPAESDHSALEAVRRFVLRVDERLQKTADGILHPRLYIGLADDSDRRESVPDFLRRLLRTDLRLNLEVISPYFDNTASAGPLRTLIDLFEPREVRVFLPLAADGKALCQGSYFDAVRKLPNTSWGKLPADLLKSGAAESAAPRCVHAKVYRFFCSSPKYEALFVGSVNLTGAAHSEGGNFETGFLIERELKQAPDWWLAVERERPAEFFAASEDDGRMAGPGQYLVLRYSWGRGVAQAFWNRPDPSPVLSLVTQSGPLFSVGPLPPREWRDLAPEQSSALGTHLRSSSFLTVKIDGEEPATILVQEEGMAQKPSILLNLSVSDILRCWATLSAEQKAVLLEERYQELAAALPGGLASALLPKIPLSTAAKASVFDAFAGIFHAFASLERKVIDALGSGREALAVHLLFGQKYDSLPHLLDRVLKEEADIEAVNRYVMLLCARQLLDGLKAEHQEFLDAHADEVRSLDSRLGEIATLREALAFGSAEERERFLSWFERWFLKRAEPIEVTP